MNNVTRAFLIALLNFIDFWHVEISADIWDGVLEGYDIFLDAPDDHSIQFTYLSELSSDRIRAKLEAADAQVPE